MKRETEAMRLEARDGCIPMQEHRGGLARLLRQVLSPARVLSALAVLFIAAACSKGGEPKPGPVSPAPADSIVSPIVFSGLLGDTVSQQMGGQAPTRSQMTATGNNGNRPLSASTGLEEKGVTDFKVWAYKTKSVSGTAPSLSYAGLQTVIDGYTVTYRPNSAGTTANTDDWEYVKGDQTIKYWDLDATSYRFLGFAPADGPVSVRLDNEELNSATQAWLNVGIETVGAGDPTPDEESSPYVSRLWFSNNSAGTEPAYLEAVRMQFIKPLTRVRFRLTDSDGKPFRNTTGTVVVSSISFKPTQPEPADPDYPVRIATAGTLRIVYPLTGTGTGLLSAGLVTDTGDESYTEPAYLDADKGMTIPYVDKDDYTDDTAVPPVDAEESAALAAKLLPDGADDTYYDKWYTLLPNTSQGSYTLSITIGGIDRTAVVPAVYMRWLPGYNYTYIFKASETGINFDAVQVGLRDWGIGEAEDRSIYNW